MTSTRAGEVKVIIILIVNYFTNISTREGKTLQRHQSLLEIVNKQMLKGQKIKTMSLSQIQGFVLSLVIS
jgi:hypothetical protein